MVSMARRWLVVTLVGLATLAVVAPAAGQGGRHRMRPHATPAETLPPSTTTESRSYEFTFVAARGAVERGEGREALAFYERAAAAAMERGDRAAAGAAYACVAFVANRLSQLQKAITSGQKALELLRAEPQVSNEQMGMMVSIYSVLGGANRAAGDRAQSRKWFDEGLSYARGAIAPTRRGAAMWVAGMLRQLAQLDYAEHAYAAA